MDGRFRNLDVMKILNIRRLLGARGVNIYCDGWSINVTCSFQVTAGYWLLAGQFLTALVTIKLSSSSEYMVWTKIPRLEYNISDTLNAAIGTSYSRPKCQNFIFFFIFNLHIANEEITHN